MYAGRSGFVALLLFGLWLEWIGDAAHRNLAQIKVQAEVADAFHATLVFIAMVMVLLAAPAATAGAICLDKARGTLLHVMVTDLSDTEIVLGKLAARLVPVLGLLASSLPVLALLTLMGGIDPVAVLGSFLVLVGVAFLGCALALTFSVWARRPYEVLLATYLVWIAWFLLVPGAAFVSWHLGYGSRPPVAVLRSNLYMLTVGANDPSDPTSPGFGEQVLFLVAATLVSAGLLALAVLRLRPVIIGQWSRGERPERGRGSVSARPRGAARLGPTLDGNPVLWREWHRNRPSRWARVVWTAFGVLAVGLSVYSLSRFWTSSSGSRDFPAVVNGFLASIGLLLLSLTSATSLSEERRRGSLDVLLASPLSSREILWGKWWGAFRSVVVLAFLPTAVSAVLALWSWRLVGPLLVLGLFLAYGAAITSLRLALATWIANTTRVLVLSVTAVVGMTIGPLPIVAILFPRAGQAGLCIAMVSPWMGVGYFSAVIAGNEPSALWPRASGFAVFWTGVYTIVAAALAVAAWITFDRCMGRMPEGTARPRHVPDERKPPRKRTVAVLDEV
jgi:ABC-type transport system involved in multi-copper enzyme maturation permease subunit